MAIEWDKVLDVPVGTVLTDETVDAFVLGFEQQGTSKERDTVLGTYPSSVSWVNSDYRIPEGNSFGTKRIPGADPFYFTNQEDEFGHIYPHFGILQKENQGIVDDYTSPVSNEKEFWIVGKSHQNRWQVRSVSVDNLEEYNLIEDLGPVRKKNPETGEWYEPIRNVCIEYDGNFELARGDDVVRLRTSSLPWLFILMSDGRLYVKKAGIPTEEVELVLLATSVVDISPCRLWRSDYYHVDQGLLISYVLEDGSVWYREYHLVGESWVWDSPNSIPTTIPETRIKCFRLNDFRAAIFLKENRKLFVSNRTYIGSTYKDEFISLDVIPDFYVFSIRNTQDESPALLSCLSVEFLDSTHALCTFNFPIFDYDSSWEDITWTGSFPSGQNIKSIDWSRGSNAQLVIELAVAMNNPRMALSFSCREHNRKGYYISEQAKPIWPALTMRKEQEPIVLDPVQNQGLAKIRLVAQLIHFDNREKRTLEVSLAEHLPLRQVATLVSFGSSEVLKLSYSDRESLMLVQITTLISFDCVQSGVTPV